MKIKYASIFLVSFLLACGGNEEGNEENNGGSDSDSSSVETTNESGKEFADIDALAEKNSFTPEEFSRATVFLYQKEATIVGFPSAYPADTEVEFKPNYTQMIDGEDNSIQKIAVTIKFKAGAEPKTMKKGELFAVKGKLDVGYQVSESWGNSTYITVYDAEFVEAGSPAAISTTADIDLTQPIHCGDLFKVMNTHYEKLFAKESVEITGDYQQTNTSTTSYGNTYDVVLGANAPVHCHMQEAPDNDALNTKRNAGEQIKISGKFAGAAYTPTVSNCVFL